MLERLAPEQHDTLPEVNEPAERNFLAGHNNEADHLAMAYRSGRLHHALMFCGPRGIGKATLAFAIARHLLQHPNAADAPEILSQPGRETTLFRQVASGAHPSLLHLTRPLDRDGKKFKTAITVDEIRRVSRFLSMTAHDGGYRIVIVDPADDMNISAANALLKNLEEPPAKTVFVLVSHSPGRLLPTIRSRCQLVRLQPLGVDELASVLESLGEPVPADREERNKLNELATGSPRNALLLSRYGGMELTSTLNELLETPTFDYEKAYRLAEAVGGREAEIQFTIINEAILDRISGAANNSAIGGDTASSAHWAKLWQEASSQIRQTSVYNLDKKQHLIGLVTKMRAQLRH